MYYIEQDDKSKDLAGEKGWQCSQEEQADYYIANQKIREGNEKTHEVINIHDSSNNNEKTLFELGHGYQTPQDTPENPTIYGTRTETL